MSVIEFLKQEGTFNTLSNIEVVEKIIEEYTGTCNPLDDEDFIFLDDNGLLGAVDERIFLCSQCGWWCDMYEAGDVDGEDCCSDCRDED